MALKFIVEGIADKKFISDLFHHLNGGELSLLDDNFIKTGGYNAKVIEINRPQIEKAYHDGYTPILIIDANGDFNARHAEIVEQLKQNSLNDLPFFILPNNVNNGNLESILLEIIRKSDENLRRLQCFDQYVICLGAGAKLPNNKAKIFAFIESFSENPKEESRDYKINKLWDLNDQYLQPLIDFINENNH